MELIDSYQEHDEAAAAAGADESKDCNDEQDKTDDKQTDGYRLDQWLHVNVFTCVPTT